MQQFLTQLLEVNLDDISAAGIPDLWQIFWAIVILLVGRWLANRSRNWFRLAIHRVDFKVNQSLISLSEAIIYYGILLIAVVLSMTSLGVPLQSMITIIGIVIILLAIALQSSLSNFAATVIFTIFQTFKAGDWIEVSDGTFGQVRELQMFGTVMVTQGRATVTIPNHVILEGNIINYSVLGYRRADMAFTVSYQADLLAAKQSLEAILAENEHVLKDPAPVVGVAQLGNKGVEFSVRPFATADNYWTVIFEVSEAAKLHFDELGITIAIPQRDVHVWQANSKTDDTE